MTARHWGMAALLSGTAALSACHTPPNAAAAAAVQPTDCGEPAPGPGAQRTPTDTSVKATATTPLSLQGQLSLKLEAFSNQPAKGLSLGFFFQGHAAEGDLQLMTLLGSQVAQLHWAPGVAELIDNQGARRYASLDELSWAALGEALPLDTLIHWMQGHPDPQWPAQVSGTGSFTQLGWLIDTSEMDARKLTATRTASTAVRGARIKVYLDR